MVSIQVWIGSVFFIVVLLGLFYAIPRYEWIRELSFDAIDDAMLIMVAGFAGAYTGQIASGETTFIGLAAFIIPAMLILWVMVTFGKSTTYFVRNFFEVDEE